MISNSGEKKRVNKKKKGYVMLSLSCSLQQTNIKINNNNRGMDAQLKEERNNRRQERSRKEERKKKIV
jgi:hypothetical protein